MLVIDDTYVARATSPAGSDTLDIGNDRVYLGANADADGKAINGYSGCITGAKLNHRDLPVSGSTKHYRAIQSSGVESGCSFEPPQGAFPTVVTYAVGGLGLLLVVIILPIIVIVCVVGSVAYCRRKKKGRYNPRMSSPSFNWQPALSRTPNTGDSRHRLMMLSQSSQVSASESFALQDLNQNQSEDSLFTPSTPAVSQHAFRTPEQSPQQARHQQSENDCRVNERLDQDDQQTPQDNPRRARRLETEQRRDGEDVHPLNKFAASAIAVHPPSIPPRLDKQLSNKSSASQELAEPVHTRSASGHQSITTTATQATSVFDDSEMGKYVLKRMEAANQSINSLQIDGYLPFKDEGEFEPLGSIGSLYDILREADENYGLTQHTYSHTHTQASRPPLKPRPQLSSLPSPSVQSQAAAATPNGSHSTKHTKLKKGAEKTNKQFSHEKEKAGLPRHTKTNGILPPQTVEVSKPREKRRRQRAVPALGAGESLMDRFQHISTSPPREHDAGKLI